MSLVLRDIAHLVTFDDADRELHGVDVVIEDGIITAVAAGAAAPPGAEVLDASHLLVLPGFVNGHQHLYQVGMRAIPELERALIGPWLGGLGARCLQYWREGRFDPATVAALARAGLVESALCGVTTVADQHYFFPGGGRSLPYVEAIIEVAAECGVRLNAGRGTLTLAGSGPDPAVIQPLDEVLRHCSELIERHHDPAPYSMVRIDLAPCGVHVDELELFVRFAELAGDHPGVGLHTHLYEAVDTAFSTERYGRTPWQLVEEAGWARPGTWLAHMCDAPHHEIGAYAASGVGIVHLVAPDLRMGWGLAPLRAYLDAGCRVGFGTTGSASNDGANLLGDLRVAALVHRSGHQDPARWPTARELLRLATRGSAEVIGRPECGRIEVGAAADIAAWDLHRVDRVGVHDPVAGLVLTGLSDRAWMVIAAGEVLVREERFVRLDEASVAAEARRRLAG